MHTNRAWRERRGETVKDNNGRTPLDIASEEQREEIIKLLEHRAK
jgi:hypothetical protein